MIVVLVGSAFATPAPNSAHLAVRVFNDCPISTLTPVNAYPASISITDDMHPACVGFANLHSWSFSETYDSPALPYDEGNPSENPPHGLWGCLHDAMVGGYFQPNVTGGTGDLTCTWSNICFEAMGVTPTSSATWGRIKALYR